MAISEQDMRPKKSCCNADNASAGTQLKNLPASQLFCNDKQSFVSDVVYTPTMMEHSGQ